MPLITGYSPKSVGHNISVEQDAGKPRNQAIAIALSKRREAIRNANKPPEPAPEGNKPPLTAALAD